MSLSLLNTREHGRRHYRRPTVALQLPEGMPRLRRLHFSHYRDWDALHRALWPLVDLAARGAFGRADARGAAFARHGFPEYEDLEVALGEQCYAYQLC